MDRTPSKSNLFFIATIALIAGELLFQGFNRSSAQAQSWAEEEGYSMVQTPETIIEGWPAAPKRTARIFIERYGQPVRFGTDALVWEGNDPWKRTVVHRESWIDHAGTKRTEILEQAIDYPRAANRSYDLARFDERISLDEKSGELISRHDSERLNYLALNLADEVITGSKTPAQARAAYRKKVWLKGAGKDSRDTQGFHFDVGPAKKR